MEMSEYMLYIRLDPRDNSVRYVGLTRDLKVRTQQILRLPGENKYLDSWIYELQAAGLLPITRVLETVRSWKAAMQRENYWIQFYLEQGTALLNMRVRGQPRLPR